jgi:hypothetical protein
MARASTNVKKPAAESGCCKNRKLKSSDLERQACRRFVVFQARKGHFQYPCSSSVPDHLQPLRRVDIALPQ